MRTRFIVEVVPFNWYRPLEIVRFERRSDIVATDLMYHPRDVVVIHRVESIDRKSDTIETTVIDGVEPTLEFLNAR